MKPSLMFASLLLLGLVAGLTSCAGPEYESVGTPAPLTGTQDVKTRPGPEDLAGFSLGEPLPTTIELEIGGKDFQIPEGATALLVGEGLPVADASGNRIGSPPEHSTYWQIARGESTVSIDDETGEVFDVDIKAEDFDDFGDILASAN